MRFLKADYVIACRHSPETDMMLKYGPDGLLAKLLADQPPAWLEAIDLGVEPSQKSGKETRHPLLVYKVNLP